MIFSGIDRSQGAVLKNLNNFWIFCPKNFWKNKSAGHGAKTVGLLIGW
jgi:hypothetical protein